MACLLVSDAMHCVLGLILSSLVLNWCSSLLFPCVQGQQPGPARSGALIGNGSPEADAAAAHGPDPTQAREAAQSQPHRVAIGDKNEANGSAENMENGQAGTESHRPGVAQMGKSK